MEVTLGGRMGGPETGIRYLAPIVALRPRLKAAFAGIEAPQLKLVEIELWIGGAITDHSADTTMRYFAQAERLKVAVGVPEETSRAVAAENEVAAVGRWIADGFASAPVPRSAQKLQLERVAAALEHALRA